MSGVLIHDGRRSGHRKWSIEAISAGNANGVVLTPFATPRIAEPRHPDAADVARGVRGVGGEVVFDAMTHALFLPNSNKRDFYDAWDLWGPAGIQLETPQEQLTHVEQVFRRQDQVGSPHLAPTLQLRSPLSLDAYKARNIARIARGLDRQSWQSLVGTRGFWSSGSYLDAYVGSLASLRAPVWVLTMANEVVVDHVPDMQDTDAFEGFCRTVHSLSLRSRVIVAHADFSGLPAVAAGADTVGSGWDRGQKTFDPTSFHINSDGGIRIPASYVTQGVLHSVLRRDTADAIERWNPPQARAIRGAAMPPSDKAQHMHHLGQLRAAVAQLNATPNRQDRVNALRARYQQAHTDYDTLIAALPRTVRQSDKNAWAVAPSMVLERYATAEGL